MSTEIKLHVIKSPAPITHEHFIIFGSCKSSMHWLTLAPDESVSFMYYTGGCCASELV